MNPSRRALALATLGVWATPAAAQRILDPVDPALSVECHSLAEVHAAWNRSEIGAGVEIPPRRLGLFARKFVQPALAEGEDIRVLGGALLVARARPDQQAWLNRWLKRIGEDADRVVHLDVRFFTVPKADYEAHCEPLLQRPPAAGPAGDDDAVDGADGRADGGTGGRTDGPEWIPVARRGVLSVAAVQKMAAALDKAGRWTVGSTPSVLVNEFQRASLATIQQQNYVATYTPPLTEAQEVLVPKVEVLQHGFTLDASATVLPEGAVGVRIVVEYTELLEMERSAFSAKHPQLEIQRPKLRRSRIDAWDAVPAEHDAIYAVPAPDADAVLLVLVRPAAVR